MKNAIRMIGLGTAILAGMATQTVAAGADADTRPGGPRHSFEELDANGDGLITAGEMQAHMQARFAAADTDGDGKLSRDELSARMEVRQEERRARRLDKMFSRRDSNGDGALSIEEMREGRAGRMFARVDADGDGAISRAEFDEMKKRHRARHGKKHWGKSDAQD